MAYRKLGINMSRRRATLRNIVTSLLKHGQIKTTEARAKELNSLAEKMITLGKRGTLHARRQALAYMTKEAAVKKLFDDIAPRFSQRPGGYTRIVKLDRRMGDGSAMALLEMVGTEFKKKAKKKKEAKKPSPAK